MQNATDYMSPVRDAANDLADRLGDALNLDAQVQAELSADLRMFAHSILDAVKAEAQIALIERNLKALDEFARP